MVPQTVVGWDLGKKQSQVIAVERTTGEILREGRISNEKESMREILDGLPRPIRVVYEATGMWQATYEALEGLVEELQMAHPLETKAIAHARIKTDKIDAATLAHLGRADLVPQAWIPPREVRDLRELLRHRAFLVRMQTRLKNKVHDILSKMGTRAPEVTDLFGKVGMAFLHSLSLREPYQSSITRCVAILETLRKHTKDVTGRINLQAKGDPRVGLITPMRGMGTYTAMLVLAEIGDISRFRRPDQLVSYAGLCPSTYQSGEVTRHGRLTKRGSRWLRWVMVEAALRYAKSPGRLGDKYRRLQRRKGFKVARVALAREMLHGIFWCLKRNEVFSETPSRVQRRSHI